MPILSQNWKKIYYLLTEKTFEVTDNIGKQNIS